MCDKEKQKKKYSDIGNIELKSSVDRSVLKGEKKKVKND